MMKTRSTALRHELKELEELISLTRRAAEGEKGVAWKLSLRGLESRQAELLEEQQRLEQEFQRQKSRDQRLRGLREANWPSTAAEMVADIMQAATMALSERNLQPIDLLVLYLHIHGYRHSEIADLLDLPNREVVRRYRDALDTISTYLDSSQPYSPSLPRHERPADSHG